MTLLRLNHAWREAILTSLVLILVTGCGESIPGPSPFEIEKRPWWNLHGDKIRAIDDSAGYDEGARSIRGYSNRQRTRRDLHLVVRDHMLSPTVLREYTKKSEIGFKITVCESAEEIRRLIRDDSSQVDLALVSARLVEEFINSNELERLDHSLLKHLGGLEWPEPVGKFFTRDLPFDRGNKYAVPYFVGNEGIAYNHAVVTEKIRSFEAFLHPQSLPTDVAKNVQGRMVLLDDDRSVISAALLSLGQNPNTTNRAALERAQQVLMQTRPFLFGHGTTNFDAFERVRLAYRMAKGEVVLAQATSGDAALAMRLNSDIEFVVPNEGSILIIDSFVIPKGAAQRGKKRLAEEFVDFLLNPVVAGTIVNFSHFASTSQPAKTFVGLNILKGPAYKFPEREQSRYIMGVMDPSTRELQHRIFGALTNSVFSDAK